MTPERTVPCETRTAEAARQFAEYNPRMARDIGLIELLNLFDELAKVRAEQAQEGWQTMDTAPKDCGNLLLYYKDVICEGYWSSMLQAWVAVNVGRVWPSHWRPLLAPPLAKDGQ